MMQGKQQVFLRSSAVAIVLVTLATVLWNFSGRNVTPVHAENNGVATTPFMGWSTWSYDGGYPTAANVEAQANVEASKLKSSGYNYVLLDDHYYLNPGTTVDQYGRWVVNSAQFPNGIAAVASYVHSLGLKFGIYVTPGIPVAAVNQNTPIQGTSYHAKDAANTSKYQNNYGGFGNVMYYLNYSSPAAQDFINSWADEYASWGVDFLKIDAVGDWNQQDVEDWSIGLQQSGRPILFDLSNTLDRSNISFWRQYSNAWRIDGDVQCYSACSTLVDWSTVATRFTDAPPWASLAAPGGWNDLDSLNVADGAKDGLTNDERQTYMTLWSIEAAPLYAGDDLTSMDSYGLSLLTNSEVIAVDQRGKAATPVSQSSNQQVWYTNNGDGSYTVALFNLGGSSSNVTANWSNLGFSGSATVRDLWSHTNLGTFSGSFSATLNTHASRLLKVVPSSGGGGVTPTPTPTPPSGFTPTPGTHYHIVNRNSGQVLDITGASTANGGLADQWPNNGGTNQEWSFTAVNGGYKVVNVNSNLLLDDPGGSKTTGTQLDQWNDTNGSNQWWNIVSAGGGYYFLVNQSSGLYADVNGASTANGATVIEWTGPGGTNQQWSFVAV